jgi:predicted DNA-binding transcriptional regulator YafY
VKIARLLSIVIYLLNRELVTARELASHFAVSIRTIQRDMEALCAAGIPIVSVQGPRGGFGIIEGYKLDRQLVDTNDLFFILTSLESIGDAFKNDQIRMTLEKVKSLIDNRQRQEINHLKDSLYIDFSALGIGQNGRELFGLLEEGIAQRRLISFRYIDSNYRETERVAEPMTIVFQWFSWYLYAFCRLRNDFRLFRLSRLRDVKLLSQKFDRKLKTFEEFSKSYNWSAHAAHLKLKFHPCLRVQVEDYFRGARFETDEKGFVIVHLDWPEDEWLHRMILGYGEYVEVLEPPEMRTLLLDKAQKILDMYQK